MPQFYRSETACVGRDRGSGIAPVIAFCRDGRWLTRARLRGWALLLVLAAVAMIVWTLLGSGLADPAGRPIGTDFLSFWSVSEALHAGKGRDVYDPPALAARERAAIGRSDAPFYAWQYPPSALLIVYPLAALPYISALAAWLLAGLVLYLSALWRIYPGRLTLLAAIAFPAVLLTVLHGQNALLATGLFGWGLLLAERRPIAAGVVIGLLSFKPQLCVLVPVALIAGGKWRMLAASGVSALAMAVASAAAFGTGSSLGFLSSLPLSREILTAGLVPYYKMQSVFALVRLLGGTVGFAAAVQAVAAVAAAGIVAWIWRRPGDAGIKGASLLAAVPLATPFFLDYDLTLLAPAIAWLARERTRGGPLLWEAAMLAAAAIAPLISRGVREGTHLLLAPLAVAGLLAATVRRARAGTPPHLEVPPCS